MRLCVPNMLTSLCACFVVCVYMPRYIAQGTKPSNLEDDSRHETLQVKKLCDSVLGASKSAEDSNTGTATAQDLHQPGLPLCAESVAASFGVSVSAHARQHASCACTCPCVCLCLCCCKHVPCLCAVMSVYLYFDLFDASLCTTFAN